MVVIRGNSVVMIEALEKLWGEEPPRADRGARLFVPCRVSVLAFASAQLRRVLCPVPYRHGERVGCVGAAAAVLRPHCQSR